MKCWWWEKEKRWKTNEIWNVQRQRRTNNRKEFLWITFIYGGIIEDKRYENILKHFNIQWNEPKNTAEYILDRSLTIPNDYHNLSENVRSDSRTIQHRAATSIWSYKLGITMRAFNFDQLKSGVSFTEIHPVGIKKRIKKIGRKIKRTNEQIC